MFLSSSLNPMWAQNWDGLVSARSKTTNIVPFLCDASKALSNRDDIHAVHFDLSKAFDVATYRPVLDKRSGTATC